MKLTGKNILIGISGGIAAYKVCYLIREIKKQGGAVRIILTKSGEKFVTRTTLEALSGEQVVTDIFDPVPSKTIQHIDIARWPDCFLVAPATTNIIAKTANGIADDILSTSIISYPGKVIFAPAMNNEMWNNSATQKNLKTIKSYGHQIIQPEIGELACDTIGIGRLAENEIILEKIYNDLGVNDDLRGKKILITAGGTEEEIDPVRYIGNRSSGKTGIALAHAALKRGADVTLVMGTHSVKIPDYLNVEYVRSAKEMSLSVNKLVHTNDALIMSAAVADYSPVKRSKTKLKKSSEKMTIDLVKTEDIIGNIGKHKNGIILVGFALETHDALKNAKNKLKNKNLDLIVLNDITEPGAGFDGDTNKVTLIDGRKDKVLKLPLMSKDNAAEKIIDKLGEFFSK